MSDDTKISLTMTIERFSVILQFLPGTRELPPLFSVLSLLVVRQTPKAALRESLSLWRTFKPTESWTHVYTDSSAELAVWKGGAGVYIQYPGGREDRSSLATSLYSTNYTAEAEALKTAAAHTRTSTHTSHNVVFRTITVRPTVKQEY